MEPSGLRNTARPERRRGRRRCSQTTACVVAVASNGAKVEDDVVSRKQSNQDRSIGLTAVIQKPRDMLDKLHWNWERYSDELRFSADGKSVGFAALDYAKTAVALQEWVNFLIAQQNRRDGTDIAKVDDDDIRWQGAVRTIANATKHARFNDDHWPGGRTTMGIVAPEELRDRVYLRMTLNSTLMEQGARWEFMLSDPASHEPIQAGDAFLANYIDWDGRMASLGYL